MRRWNGTPKLSAVQRYGSGNLREPRGAARSLSVRSILLRLLGVGPRPDRCPDLLLDMRLNARLSAAAVRLTPDHDHFVAELDIRRIDRCKRDPLVINRQIARVGRQPH